MTKCYLPQHHPTKQWTIKSTIHVLIVVLVLKHFVVDGGGVEGVEQYSHQWAAHIVGGNSVVDEIARKHGFINQGEIFPDYYHLVHRKVAKRSVEAHTGVHGRLTQEPAVRWAQQQRVKQRSKRDFLPLSPSFSGSRGGIGDRERSRASRRSKSFTINDPRWAQMWYLNRGNRGTGLDMNVIEAWNEGITGKGIVVTILDDGLEKDHPDIIRNYPQPTVMHGAKLPKGFSALITNGLVASDPLASFDVNNLDTDPMPTYDLTDSNRHGTRCAGEVAAEANNSICAVGIAYEAGIGGVRMLDGDVTDAVEARSLSHNPQHIDIYSASWGPDDDGKTVDGPGELATRAFMEGVAKGRNGRGSIYIWASGNGGRDHDNCNCDGYTNSIWTLSISSATENGLVPWYSEACSSTLATTYSSGGTGEKQIVTIDLHHSCTQSHTGTSASAPLAAGICALALQANTNLTWRDMQHIVVRTARPNNLIASDWATNGVGRNVSHSFGYGLMDAGAMVKLAKKWINVPEQHKCEIKAPYVDKNIPAKSKVTLDLKVTECPQVKFLEHVQAKVTLMSGRRGDLQIYLVSPSGTRSVLLAHRRHDLNRSGFTDWPFMTVHGWGESPIGKWTLEIHNEGRYSGRTVLKRWSLIAYGTEEDVNSGDVNENWVQVLQDNIYPVEKKYDNISTINPSTNNRNENFSRKNITAKTAATAGHKEPEGTETSQVLTYNSNVNNTSESKLNSSRKPSRPRQSKVKTITKKQKAAAVQLETIESHVITSNAEEDRRLLKSLFTLNQNQSIFVAATEIPHSSPFDTSVFASYASKKTEQHRSINTKNETPIEEQGSGEVMTSTVASVNRNLTGNLQTWSLIAHGIESDPNISRKNNGSKNNGVNQGSRNGGEASFGIANTVSASSNHDTRSEQQQLSNSKIAADSSLSMLSTSVASSSSDCAKISDHGQCLSWCLLIFLIYFYFEEFHDILSSLGSLIPRLKTLCFNNKYNFILRESLIGRNMNEYSSCEVIIGKSCWRDPSHLVQNSNHFQRA